MCIRDRDIVCEVRLARLPDTRPPRFRASITDVTQRKQAEANLADSQSRLQNLMRAIPDLVWLKDPNGAFLMCNQRFERLIGAVEKDIIGKTDYDLVDAELADFFRRHDNMAVGTVTPSVNEEWLTFADDGHREYVEVTKTPLWDAQHHLVGILGIAHDITERTQLEATLRKHDEYQRALRCV